MQRSIILLIIIISANLLYAIKGIPNSIRARNCLLQIECNSICRLPLKKKTTLKQLSTRGVKSREGKSSFDRSANDSSKDIVQLRKRQPLPVSISILRNGLYKRREPLPSFHMLPRKAFDDIAHPTSDGIPVLMEAFTFCQQRDLVFNSVINLFYLGENIKHRKAYQFSKCQAELNGFIAEDEMVDDPLSRVIVSSFRFPGMCSSRNNEIAISCDTINSTYHITPIHIHYENTTRYYLSVCTSIASVDPLLVRAWIYYYYANGVEHFTFYLNEQKEFWKRVLRDFQQTGLVDLLDFEYKYHISHRDQEAALESCNLRYRNTSRFVIYNDIDEFFVPMNPKWRIVDVVHLYDNLYPNADAFRVFHSFHGCGDLLQRGYQSYDISRICNKRLKEVLPRLRMKSIANPSRSLIIQQHYTDHGINTPIDYNNDMVLIHFKRNKDLKGYNLTRDASSFSINPVVHSFLELMEAQRSKHSLI